MSIESLLALAAAVFVFALKPGPGIMMAMTRSVSDGYRGLGTFLIGFNIGLAVYLGIVFIGLETLHIDIIFLSVLVKSLAAVYLIYLGIKGFQTPNPKMRVEEAETQSLLDNVSSAMMLTLSNPMIIVFYASIIPVFINPDTITLNMIFFIMAMLMIIDSLGMVIYCLPLILFRKTIPQSFMDKVRVISSIIIIMIGLYIGYTAIGAVDILSVF
ncbi:MAG: LysE family translocator [Alphaproteobacteria bacterium]|nr:LysE family translocator [Alphaproteobacteria bacterium]NCQ88233.1 LysE family translocator [Alphaproteobacteria bacterium]NCT05260.1 LysE family translocator [Alphaproteobacteria bacterium]